MRESGHTRFKFRIPGDPELIIRGLAEARRIAGAQPLMADATQGFSLELASRLAPALQDLQLDWLEEPLPVDDLDSYRRWVQLRDRPLLAMGENIYGPTGSTSSSASSRRRSCSLTSPKQLVTAKGWGFAAG